jgi:FkbM family methyltransferase
MASFAAAVMGFKVLAFEPVIDNLKRICDGIWFNRVADLVTVFEAAVSDRIGNITFYKVKIHSFSKIYSLLINLIYRRYIGF